MLRQLSFRFTPLHERRLRFQYTPSLQKVFQFTPLHKRRRLPLHRLASRRRYFNSRLYMRGNSCAAVCSFSFCVFQFTPLHERQLQKYTIFSIKSTQFSTKPCFFIVTSRKVVFFSIPVQYFL